MGGLGGKPVLDGDGLFSRFTFASTPAIQIDERLTFCTERCFVQAVLLNSFHSLDPLEAV